MAAEAGELLRHALEITFYDLPATASIRLDFTPDAGAEILIAPAIPAIRLGASYGGGQMGIQGITLTPRRLQFEVDGAPSSLPLTISVRSSAAFLHGWLQVPDGVQTCIASAVEKIRFVGPGYWAVPLIQNVRAEAPAGRPVLWGSTVPAPARPAAAKASAAKPAAAKSAPAGSGRPAPAAKPASKPSPRPDAAATAAPPSAAPAT